MVAKISSDGQTVVWARYLGGDGDETIGGFIRVDPSGNIYHAPPTFTTDGSGTTVGAFDRTFGGGETDMAVHKLASDGTEV